MKNHLAARSDDYVATTNACKACMPLGACLAFKGIEGCVPFLHGSQGCATYMRRYLISHFREPVDIASSALGETQAVFGGGPNLKKGLVNVINKYQARAVGIATTCLTETIGDDVPAMVREFLAEARVQGEGGEMPALIAASTPAYGGTHLEGFHAAVAATVAQLAAKDAPAHAGINLLPGLVSPADLRHLSELMEDFGLSATMLPDYSRTLDAPALESYEILPAGGTPIKSIRAMGGARATIELGRALPEKSAGVILRDQHQVPLISLGLPIGLRANTDFFAALAELAGRPVPRRHEEARGRLLDAMVDGHKYVAGQKAVVFGDEDLVIGLTAFLAEIGVQPVVCASGGESGNLTPGVEEVTRGLTRQPPLVAEGADFDRIGRLAKELKPDLLIGNGKGYRLSRELEIPLVRVGLPIHDRFGGPRLHHLGYLGAQEIYDRLVNTLLAHKQDQSPWGYTYL